MNKVTLEFGPDTNGWMRIDLHGEPVGTLVWVGDNTAPGYGSYQIGLVYWDWADNQPFPPEDFRLRRVPDAAPPEYSSGMIAFPNAGFGASKVVNTSRTLSVTLPQTSYQVTPSPDCTPPVVYGLVAKPEPEYQLLWSASGNKSSEQTSFWPYSAANSTLSFRYLDQDTFLLEAGTTGYPVDEKQI